MCVWHCGRVAVWPCVFTCVRACVHVCVCVRWARGDSGNGVCGQVLSLRLFETARQHPTPTVDGSQHAGQVVFFRVKFVFLVGLRAWGCSSAVLSVRVQRLFPVGPLSKRKGWAKACLAEAI
eukprot:3506664-Rhodomonas_salina.1